jgi:hypothetical protein
MGVVLYDDEVELFAARFCGRMLSRVTFRSLRER